MLEHKIFAWIGLISLIVGIVFVGLALSSLCRLMLSFDRNSVNDNLSNNLHFFFNPVSFFFERNGSSRSISSRDTIQKKNDSCSN